jgi:hypothetical protein
LAQFLGEELRLELSKEKTLITSPQDGFVFLGYRVVQAQSYRKARLVGKLRIPREKLSDLRREIKQRTARRTIGRSLKELIWTLNPLIVGWRTYFQYATGAYREFHTLDDWLWRLILRWLKKKHRKGGSWELRKRFSAGTTAPLRGRWRDGKVLLRQFSDGGTKRYRNRGIRIPNGWNAAPGEWFLSGTTAEFWAGYRAMATMSPTRSL